MSVRAFAPEGWTGAVGDTLTLEREESHYTVRVRRRRAGDALELLLVGGGGYEAVVLEDDAKRCRIEVGARLPERPCLGIDLAVGIVESKAAIDVVSRACEGGARSLLWLDTAHSQPTAPSSERVERVLRAAQRQCGRLHPLHVRAPQAFSSWVAEAPAGCVAALEGSEIPRGPSAAPSGVQALLIGPEGGLTADELAAATAAGLAPLRLGPYILRTEVAVVAGLAAMSQHAPAAPTDAPPKRIG